jgi:lipopolysaccharide export system permease protein
MVTFLIVMFVLLMLFLFKYVDDLIGKGFEWYVILELLGYQSLVQISMAMPLSMLLSSIMTFGNLGESYELVAIKAAGISLRKAMMPLFILVGIFSGGAFLFSDYILPVVNLKMGSLLYDVRNKQADFLITPGIFNKSIDGYSIRARSKSKDGKILYDLMIYDHSNHSNARNVLLAKEGFIYNSEDDRYMILKLKDGVRYEDSQNPKSSRYDPRQQFTRFYFEETEQKFNMEGFQLKRTDENLFKSHHAMLNLKQLQLYTDSNQLILDSVRTTVLPSLVPYYFIFVDRYAHPDSLASPRADAPMKPGPFFDQIQKDVRHAAVSYARGQARYIKDDILLNKSNEDKLFTDRIIKYDLEWQRKFTLAVSCLLLFAIGAPLGAIIRKGGLGLPVVVAIIFFLIYHIISTVAEKSAKEGNLDAFTGMWMAIIVLTPVAAFLGYKSATDSALFDLEMYRIKYELMLTKIKRWFGDKKSQA